MCSIARLLDNLFIYWWCEALSLHALCTTSGLHLYVGVLYVNHSSVIECNLSQFHSPVSILTEFPENKFRRSSEALSGSREALY